MLFDTHAHYDDSWFDEDRDALLRSMAEQGVGLILNPGCHLESSEKALAYAHTYDFMYAAVGFHPSDAHRYDAAAEERLREMAHDSKVKAIGEIGLDYYWEDYPSKAVQGDVLRRQMALAQELNLPVIFHDREAHGDSLAAVKEFPNLRGVFHCYSGSLEDAKTLISLGWSLSFTGSVTYKNNKKAPDILKWVPNDRFMVETDAPYMLPYPRVKGEKRNDSTKVWRVADKIAQCKGISREEVERLSWENGRKFFGI